MGVSINNWFGRLGNNIIQLTSALSFCEKNKTNLTIPKHDVITKTEINLNGENNLTYSNLFWGDYVSDDERRKLAKKYILPILKHKHINLTDKDLIIHLRGGDIFSHNPPKNYVQAPISYVEKIIQTENPKNIIIVYEDFSNPSVNHLINNYKNIVLVNDLIEGISYILSAKKIVITGVGTFANSLVMCSNNIEKVFVPSFLKKDNNNDNTLYDYDCCVDYSDLEIIKINIPNYLTTNSWEWNNEIKNLYVTHKL